MSDYPAELERVCRLKDGSEVLIRPIRPEDAEIEQAFVKALSDESRYFRFMEALNELTPAMLRRFTQIDYRRHLALIALIGKDPDRVEIGVARYVCTGESRDCEFAIVVADQWQGKGLGTLLMGQLIDAARVRGVECLYGDVLAGNRGMLQLMGRLGFSVDTSPDDPTQRRVHILCNRVTNA